MIAATKLVTLRSYATFMVFDGVFVDKDPPSSNDLVNFKRLDILNKNHDNFIKYSKTFLCVIDLSRVYDDKDNSPIFLDSDDKVGETTLAAGEVSLLKEIEDWVIHPFDKIITIIDHTIAYELKDAAGGDFDIRPAVPNAQKFTIISSDSTHTEPLNTSPSSSLKSISNPLPKQTKVVTLTTSPVHEAVTSSVVLDNASFFDDFYESWTIDYTEANV
ncbi:hypothetical protein Tco_0088817 [Tanacetum coccineum]